MAFNMKMKISHLSKTKKEFTSAEDKILIISQILGNTKF